MDQQPNIRQFEQMMQQIQQGSLDFNQQQNIIQDPILFKFCIQNFNLIIQQIIDDYMNQYEQMIQCFLIVLTHQLEYHNHHQNIYVKNINLVANLLNLLSQVPTCVQLIGKLIVKFILYIEDIKIIQMLDTMLYEFISQMLSVQLSQQSIFFIKKVFSTTQIQNLSTTFYFLLEKLIDNDLTESLMFLDQIDSYFLNDKYIDVFIEKQKLKEIQTNQQFILICKIIVSILESSIQYLNNNNKQFFKDLLQYSTHFVMDSHQFEINDITYIVQLMYNIFHSMKNAEVLFSKDEIKQQQYLDVLQKIFYYFYNTLANNDPNNFLSDVKKAAKNIIRARYNGDIMQNIAQQLLTEQLDSQCADFLLTQFSEYQQISQSTDNYMNIIHNIIAMVSKKINTNNVTYSLIMSFLSFFDNLTEWNTVYLQDDIIQLVSLLEQLFFRTHDYEIMNTIFQLLYKLAGNELCAKHTIKFFNTIVNKYLSSFIQQKQQYLHNQTYYSYFNLQFMIYETLQQYCSLRDNQLFSNDNELKNIFFNTVTKVINQIVTDEFLQDIINYLWNKFYNVVVFKKITLSQQDLIQQYNLFKQNQPNNYEELCLQITRIYCFDTDQEQTFVGKLDELLLRQIENFQIIISGMLTLSGLTPDLKSYIKQFLHMIYPILFEIVQMLSNIKYGEGECQIIIDVIILNSWVELLSKYIIVTKDYESFPNLIQFLYFCLNSLKYNQVLTIIAYEIISQFAEYNQKFFTQETLDILISLNQNNTEYNNISIDCLFLSKIQLLTQLLKYQAYQFTDSNIQYMAQLLSYAFSDNNLYYIGDQNDLYQFTKFYIYLNGYLKNQQMHDYDELVYYIYLQTYNIFYNSLCYEKDEKTVLCFINISHDVFERVKLENEQVHQEMRQCLQQFSREILYHINLSQEYQQKLNQLLSA